MCYQGRVFVVEKQAVYLDIVALGIVALDIVALDIVALDIALDTVDQHAGYVLGYRDGCVRKVLISCPVHVDLSSDVVALVAPLLSCLFQLPKVYPLLAGPNAGLDAYRQRPGAR